MVRPEGGQAVNGLGGGTLSSLHSLGVQLRGRHMQNPGQSPAP